MASADRLLQALRLHWPLGVVLAVAVLLRTANLFPTYFYGDDAEYAIVARSLSEDPRALAYPDLEGFGSFPFVSQPPLLIYLFALSSRIFGDVEIGAVLVSVLLGTATCGLVYALGLRLQGRTTGMLGGLFLAVLPMHVNLSRKAFLDAGFTFFATLTILLFLVWIERRSLGWAAAAGSAAAGTVFSKLPGVLIAVPLVAGLAWEFWKSRAPPLASVNGEPDPFAALEAATDGPTQDRTTLLRQTGFALIPLAALTLPYLALIWYLRASRNLVEKLGWQAGRVAGTEDAGTDRPWHWYLTDPDFSLMAQLGILLFLLSLIGIGLLLHRAWKRPDTRNVTLVLLLWPAVFLLFFTLSGRKEWFYLLPVAPAMTLLAALPLGLVLVRLHERGALSPRAYRPATPTAILVAVLLVAAGATAFPTSRSLADHVMRDRTYGYGVKEAALWIQDEDPTAAQIGTLLGRFTLKFYNDQPTYHFYNPHDYVDQQIEGGRIRYLVFDEHLNLTQEKEWMQDLVDRYDGRVVQEYSIASGNVKVRVFELRPATA